MLLTNNIEIIDLGLFLKKEKILIFTDTQIGYEESLNKKGVLIPRFQYDDLQKRIKKIIVKCKPKTIIINGDIKHEFGTISDTEWRYVLRFIDFLSIYARLILIKGNHDTILEPIAKKKNIEVKNYFKIGDVFLCHGHRILENKEIESSKVIIIGHEHPAVGLKEGSRVEKFKCFLKGKFDDKILIVQPSTNLITIGTNVLTEKLLSPYLDQNLINFEVYVVADEIMYFGKIKNLI